MPTDEQMDAVQSPPSGKAELFAEWRADYHAARVRDYGEADAATYEQRVRDGAKMMTPPSITAAILDNPKSFLTPEQQQDGNEHVHDSSPDRGR